MNLTIGTEVRNSKGETLGKLSDFEAYGKDVTLVIDESWDMVVHKSQIKTIIHLTEGFHFYRVEDAPVY